ncbi:hypothetical protein FRX31_003019 [Thalictrum thalictroides]|uniref:RNase H type-1 domain-containing protein n=1 Tax=Thalictrum thalictroides TaxID=46969 RepID=A0A7J6XCD3_THATH|nr:hypothetical protein FRX31_003019 [Thalictrum thalictroides]
MVEKLTNNSFKLKTTSRETSPSSIWIPQNHGILKMNVDISFTKADCFIGIGFILRYSNGLFICASSDSGLAGNVEEAECKGILSAVCRGTSLKLKEVIIEFDCRGAINYLQGKDSNISWTANNVLDEAIHTASTFGLTISFSFCLRTGNQFAHLLAGYAQTSSLVPILFNIDWLLSQICLDKLFYNYMKSVDSE